VKGRTKRLSWALWALCSLAAGAALADRLVSEPRSRQLFLPGRTTDGHYQIELECAACHTPRFTSADDLQAACISCHGAELAEAKDSHPTSKFTDPRNAERVALLDGRLCITCHAEHRPERTGSMGLSLPGDYCYHCHEDVGTERESHVGLAFDSCASSGCHNFHDNRALYEDYLVQHGSEPWLLSAPLIAKGGPEPARKSSAKALGLGEADGPAFARQETAAWLASAHAEAGVNCSGCHQGTGAGFSPDVPSEVCGTCHAGPTEGWLSGRHGMRVKTGAQPMRVSEARKPMKASAHDSELSCSSCHGNHGTETERAALEACEACHDDEHTRAYRRSKHFALLMEERSGRIAAGGGVSCASCHLPKRVDEGGRPSTQHNQNDNLRPAEKMIRTACQSCHGLPFSIDSLADRALAQRNFDRAPSAHVLSVDFALERAK